MCLAATCACRPPAHPPTRLPPHPPKNLTSPYTIQKIYETQKLLEAESQLLRAELRAARGALGAWAGRLAPLQRALKEAGDLEHYSERLAGDAARAARALGLRDSAAAAAQTALAAAPDAAAGAEGDARQQQHEEPAAAAAAAAALPVSTGASR